MKAIAPNEREVLPIALTLTDDNNEVKLLNVKLLLKNTSRGYI